MQKISVALIATLFLTIPAGALQLKGQVEKNNSKVLNGNVDKTGKPAHFYTITSSPSVPVHLTKLDDQGHCIEVVPVKGLVEENDSKALNGNVDKTGKPTRFYTITSSPTEPVRSTELDDQGHCIEVVPPTQVETQATE